MVIIIAKSPKCKSWKIRKNVNKIVVRSKKPTLLTFGGGNNKKISTNPLRSHVRTIENMKNVAK